jgi:pimeloyl-ACP methyl ester carboxylesterase
MKNTLIIVPGWMHTSREWATAAAQLPEWDVQVVDLPGFGVVPLISKDWGVPEYASFVIENIKYKVENIEQGTKLILLGHSFGGRVLAHIYGKQKELAPHADALILYAAPCLHRPRVKIRAKNILARMAKKIGIARILSDSLKPYDLRQATDSGLDEIFKRSVGYDQAESLKNISVPTHLLWGSNDMSAPLRIAEEMHTLIPHSTLTILPNEGHNIHLDNPTLFYGTLRKILMNISGV